MRNESGESSQPRAREQVEQRSPDVFHEYASLNDVLRDQDVFRPASLPDCLGRAHLGVAPVEKSGTKRSAQEASLSTPGMALESVAKKRCISEATKEKLSRQRQIDHLFGEGPFSQEAQEKHKAATKAAMNRPEVKEKHKEALNRPEVKEKRQAAIKAAMNRPEVKEKHKEAMKAVMSRPEVREKHKEAMKAAYARPEVKEKHKEATKAAMNRPEVKEKIRKARQAKNEVFRPEELTTANSAVSQALGGGKSYAWMKQGESSQQR